MLEKRVEHRVSTQRKVRGGKSVTILVYRLLLLLKQEGKRLAFLHRFVVQEIIVIIVSISQIAIILIILRTARLSFKLEEMLHSTFARHQSTSPIFVRCCIKKKYT
jgi:hypothetical protein